MPDTSGDHEAQTIRVLRDLRIARAVAICAIALVLFFLMMGLATGNAWWLVGQGVVGIAGLAATILAYFRIQTQDEDSVGMKAAPRVRCPTCGSPDPQIRARMPYRAWPDSLCQDPFHRQEVISQ